MPILILSGGKGKNKESKLHSLFLKLVKNQPILYIPIAKKPKLYNECYNWLTLTLKRKNITMLTDLSEEIDLNNFKGIYIGGGNTFKLLKEIKENKFDKKLKNFKGIIYGGSAGAIIFGKTIETSSFGKIIDPNKVKLKDLTGLNLVNNYNIKCHYYKEEKKEIQNYVKKTKIPVIALPEDSGIYVKNNNIKNINKIILFKSF